MKSLVIYKSKTGFTKKYAQWIAEDLSADLVDVSKVDINMMESYDAIIYGGSLHAVGIDGVRFITKNIDKLKDKKIVVFATGASPVREEDINKVREKNFTSDLQKYIHFVYLRGGFNYTKLPLWDKFLMTLLKWKIKSKKQLTNDEKGMLSVYDKPIDFTRKKYINEIIEYINS